jgi:hypothetical protein
MVANSDIRPVPALTEKDGEMSKANKNQTNQKYEK